MKLGPRVVPALSQENEILTGAGGYVAVQLQVQVAQIGVQAQVALLGGVALHAHPLARVLGDHIDCCGGEGPGRRTCR